MDQFKQKNNHGNLKKMGKKNHGILSVKFKRWMLGTVKTV